MSSKETSTSSILQWWFLSDIPSPEHESAKVWIKSMMKKLKFMHRHHQNHRDANSNRILSSFSKLLQPSHKNSVYTSIIKELEHYPYGTTISHLRKHAYNQNGLSTIRSQHIALKIRSPRKWHHILTMQDYPKPRHWIIRIEYIQPKTFRKIIHHVRRCCPNMDLVRLAHRLVWAMLCFQYTLFPYRLMLMDSEKRCKAFMERITISATWFWTYFEVEKWIDGFGKRYHIPFHKKCIMEWFRAWVNHGVHFEAQLENTCAMKYKYPDLRLDMNSESETDQLDQVYTLIKYCLKHDMFKHDLPSKMNLAEHFENVDDEFWFKLAKKAKIYIDNHTDGQSPSDDVQLAKYLKRLSVYQHGVMPFNFVRHGCTLFKQFKDQNSSSESDSSQSDSDSQQASNDQLWRAIYEWFNKTGIEIPEDTPTHLWRIACMKDARICLK